MKLIHLTSMAALCLGLAGCEQSDAPAPETSASRTNTSSSSLTVQARETAPPPAKPFTEIKHEALTMMTNALAAWDGKINELQKRTDGLTDAAKAEGDIALKSVRHEFDQAGKCLANLTDAGKEQWAEAKTKLDDAVAKLAKAYDEAVARFE
jgi:hypothetical protein